MKFFFPDSQDLVDPSFDFIEEKRSRTRIRQRDDQYAHEVLKRPPYDGMLVSKAIVDGSGNGGAGRYTLGQRHRFYREGVRGFLRLEDSPMEIMGDCGAFTYVKEPTPPISIDEVIGFYDECEFDYGVSVDHIILQFDPTVDSQLPGMNGVPDECQERFDITIDNAKEFYRKVKKGRFNFKPIGVAQAWSPESYADSVKALQKIGFKYIALGGLVPLSTVDIMLCLNAIDKVRKKDTALHLFGVSRCDHVAKFNKLGVVSFDSTSPLRQAFKEDVGNYHTIDGNYTAIRVPQVEGNAAFRKKIAAGKVNQDESRRLETACMELLVRFDKGRGSRKTVLSVLGEYQELYGSGRDYIELYRETLTDKPWKQCKCDICKAIGIHVIIFRGAERNRRRGFHNVFVTNSRLRRRRGQLKTPAVAGY